MSVTWTDEETFKLIEIWSDDCIQGMLDGCRRNKDAFKKILREMEAANFEKTAEQCNNKIRKLSLEYRKVVDERTKRKRKKRMEFLDAMDAVLGRLLHILPL